MSAEETRLVIDAITARARGDRVAERAALDDLALIERSEDNT